MKTQRYTHIIGIDAGTDTGFGVHCTETDKAVMIATMKIHQAMSEVLRLHSIYRVFVRVEDARLRSWFGSAGPEKLQGAGSIKRDCVIWEDFLADHEIPFEMVAPAAGKTKWDEPYFNLVTGWHKRTSSHGRDAYVLAMTGSPIILESDIKAKRQRPKKIV